MTWDALLPRNAARLMRGGGGPELAKTPPAGADVTFSFFAPRNAAVNLVGDFTAWLPQPMQGDGRGWWRCAWHLPNGEYRYRFQVLSVTPWLSGRWVTVTDPRSPCRPPGRTANTICIADGQIRGAGYIWRHDDAPLALDETMRRTRLTPDSPCFGGAMPACRAVVEALDEMAAGGVGVIIVPSVATTPALGYDVGRPFFPAGECAQVDSFKDMVDECHGRGIRVIVEMEAGQGDPSGTLAQIDYGYWYALPLAEADSVGAACFDYEHRDERSGLFPAQEFVRACVFHWLDTYHIDGVRFLGAASEAERAFLSGVGGEARAAFKPFCVELG